jgi:hypothetical protein
LSKPVHALLGEPPLSTPGLWNARQSDAELKTLTKEIWGSENESDRFVGKGRVFCGIPTEEALKRLRVPPDFIGPDGITWIHRKSGDHDIYFIASPSNQAVTLPCTFRVSEKHAELWNPETGEISQLATSIAGDGRTSAAVPLGPDGSAFIVFHPGSPTSNPIKTTVMDESQEIKGPWTVAFPADSGASKSLQIDPLVSWSVHPDPNVRHFSGTATYTNHFEIQNLGSGISIDLGKVEIMARVRVNDKDLGIIWKAPYQVDISSAVVPGKNRLEISVVNLWVNRLIGDQSIPEDSERDKAGNLTSWPQWAIDGETSPTKRRSFVTFPLWKANETLRISGLLGPVVLRSASKSRAEGH